MAGPAQPALDDDMGAPPRTARLRERRGELAPGRAVADQPVRSFAGIGDERIGLEMPIPDAGKTLCRRLAGDAGRKRHAQQSGQQSGEKVAFHGARLEANFAAKLGQVARQLSLVGATGASPGGKGEAGMPSSARASASSGVASPQIARSSVSP